MRTASYLLSLVILITPFVPASAQTPGTEVSLDRASKKAATPSKSLSDVFVTVSGNISTSIDGVGTNNSSASIQVEKPSPGATVRRAFLITAAAPNVDLSASDIVLTKGNKSQTITASDYDNIVLGANGEENGRVEITSLVSSIVNPASAGMVDVTVEESSPSSIEGMVLAVIFDDPSVSESRSVSLVFGAQQQAGDSFSISLGEPFDDSSVDIEMSLGISFGFQPTSQVSLVDVNGSRMTSSAGGQDDCDIYNPGTGNCGNGALLTVGGIGDDPSNPADPNDDDPADARVDDELYTLDSFINDGDTNISVRTENPSFDDNIFFAAFIVNGGTAVVGQGITLAPPSATKSVGDDHTVTATVENDQGDPVQGRTVEFEITAGPNSGRTASSTTNSDGKASFSWTSSTAGTDVIVAESVDNNGNPITSNKVEVEWTEDGPVVTTEAATSVVARQAQLNGSVNPNGSKTTVEFNYHPTGFSERTQTVVAKESPVTGDSKTSVSALISDLEPNTQYTFEVVAGGKSGGTKTFTTSGGPPQVETGAVSGVTATEAQFSGTVDPNRLLTDVTFTYYPEGQRDQAQSVTANESPLTGVSGTSVTAQATGLEPKTDYVVKAIAENDAGSKAGTEQTFTTEAGPPTVSTKAATDVTRTEAQLNGTVDPNDSETTVEFTYYPTGTPDSAKTLTAAESPLTGDGDRDVSVQLSGLKHATEYTFVVSAANSFGSQSGGDKTFTTASVAPLADTKAATNLTTTSAQLNGVVRPRRSKTTVAFKYYPTGNPDRAKSVTPDGSPLTGTGSQSVDAKIDKLAPSTKYTYVVLAENRAGSTTGGKQTFTTKAAPPTAVTGAASRVTETSARLNGEVNPKGSETVVEFEYYRTGHPDDAKRLASDESPLQGIGTPSVGADVTGLEPGTEYTFEVVAENSAGSDAGGAQTFTTDARPPIVQTGDATSITVTSAQLNGTVNPRGAETTAEFEYYPEGQPGEARRVVAEESPLTGRSAQSVHAPVADLKPETDYFFRVIATNSAAVREGDQATFATPPLEVALSRASQVPGKGSPVTATATVSEGFAPTETARLYYRRVGEDAYRSVPLEPAGETAFEGTIPGSAVTERGLEYYVRLANGSLSVTVPETEPTSKPRYAPVRVSGLEAEIGVEPDQYRMISVPLRLETPGAVAQLRDDFGAPDRSEWRLLRWNAETESYREVTREDEDGDLVPGRSYWLISESGQTQDGDETFDVGAGRSVLADPIELTLPPGWTQIANPRPYPVAWSSVRGRESVMSPVSYDPAASDSVDYDVEVLQPWGGYWLHNPGSSTVQIRIPSPEAGVAQEVAGVGTEGARGDDTIFDDEPAYAIAMEAHLKREHDRSLTDRHTVMGVAENASSSVGVEDVAEPPAIGEHLGMSIVEEDVHLAGSLRPTGKDGYTWELEVTSSDGTRGVVRGELEVRGSVPPTFERRLMDLDTGRQVRTENGTFEIRLTQDRPTRRFRLVVGVEEYAEAQSEAVRPDRSGLRAVYPNPSSGRVSVDYHLDSPQRIQIRVYDVLGRRVQTLVDRRRPAGHHTVRWDAESGDTPVSSGAYIVRMTTESTTVSRRVSIVR